MKKLVFITFILGSIVSYSQIKERDPNLIGSWKGSEMNNKFSLKGNESIQILFI